MVISTEIRKINNNLRHQCTNFDLLSQWFIASLLSFFCWHLYLFLSGSFKILRADRFTNSQSRTFEFFNQSEWQWVLFVWLFLNNWLKNIREKLRIRDWEFVKLCGEQLNSFWTWSLNKIWPHKLRKFQCITFFLKSLFLLFSCYIIIKWVKTFCYIINL